MKSVIAILMAGLHLLAGCEGEVPTSEPQYLGKAVRKVMVSPFKPADLVCGEEVDAKGDHYMVCTARRDQPDNLFRATVLTRHWPSDQVLNNQGRSNSIAVRPYEVTIRIAVEPETALSPHEVPGVFIRNGLHQFEYEEILIKENPSEEAVIGSIYEKYSVFSWEDFTCEYRGDFLCKASHPEPVTGNYVVIDGETRFVDETLLQLDPPVQNLTERTINHINIGIDQVGDHSAETNENLCRQIFERNGLARLTYRELVTE